MGILRVMSRNRELALMHMHKFKDTRKIKISTLFGKQGLVHKLLKRAKQTILDQDRLGALRWPPEAGPAASTGGQCQQAQVHSAWTCPRQVDPGCERRKLSMVAGAGEFGVGLEDVKAFFGFPLSPVGLSSFVGRSSQNTRRVLRGLPFDLTKHQ